MLFWSTFQFLITFLIPIINRNKAPLLSLIIICASIYTMPIYWYSPSGNKGLIYLFDILIPFVFMYSLNDKKIFIDKKILKFGFCLWGMSFISLVFFNLFYGYEQSNQELLLTLVWFYRSIGLLICLNYLDKNSFVNPKILLKIIAIVLLTNFSIGTAGYILSWDLAFYEYSMSFGNPVVFTYSNNGFLGMFRGAVGFFGYIGFYIGILMSEDREKNNRVIGVFLILTTLYCTYMSGSRAGLLGILTFYFCYVILMRFSFKKVVNIFLILAVSLFMLYNIENLGLLGGRFEMSGENAGHSRLESWSNTFKVLSNDLYILLMGIGGFNPSFGSQLTGTYGSHNSYIDVIFRHGVIGGSFIIVVLFSIFKQLNKAILGNELNLFRPFIIGLSIVSITQETIFFNANSTYLSAVFFWVLMICLSKEEQRNT